MAVFIVHLTSTDGFVWNLTCTVNSTFILRSPSGSAAICSPHVSHDIEPGQKQFSLYMANAYISFPYSEFKKYKEFIRQVKAAKEAA